MWNKLTNALKPRVEAEEEQPSQPSTLRQGNVLAKVLEQHPNLSVFAGSSVSLPHPSPPASPSKHGRLGLFKRGKSGKTTNDENEPSGSFRLPLGKKRPALQMQASGSTISLQPPPSIETRSPSLDVPRASEETLPETPSDSRRAFGSVRSILREKNTPGTGQNVRFFSRDAFHVISPDTSVNNDSSHHEPTFMQKLQEVSPERFSKVEETQYFSPAMCPDDMLSPPPNQNAPPPDRSLSPICFSPLQAHGPSSSPLTTVPPPDLSNLFDLSQEFEVAPIPMNVENAMKDNAMEVTDGEETSPEQQDQDMAQSPDNSDEQPEYRLDRNMSLGRRAGERISNSISASSALGRMKSTSSLSLHRLFNGEGKRKGSFHSSMDSSSSFNRNRFLSENLLLAPSVPEESLNDSMVPPELDINDESASRVVVYGNPEQPDPFRMNATTYFTPDAKISNSPPRSHHAKTNSSTSAASRSVISHSSSRYDDMSRDDVLHTVRTQLALQQELSKQYEIDLSARDELVFALQAKLQSAETDATKRRNVVRGWKKKVAELEKVCRNLEDEVNMSRQESFERSIMDEASGDALRELHRQINNLEREKSEVEKQATAAAESKALAEKALQEKTLEVQKLRDVLQNKEKDEKALQDGIFNAKEQLNSMGTYTDAQDELRTQVEKGEQAFADEQERHRLLEFAWDEEREALTRQIQGLERDRDILQTDIAESRDKLLASENEIAALKSELEAQLRVCETQSEKIDSLEKERDGLRADLEALETRLSDMEVEWTESENRKTAMEGELSELWGLKEQLEKERDEVTTELNVEREEVDKLKHQLQSCSDEVALTQQERQFDVDRLETLLRERDEEVVAYSGQINELKTSTEELQTKLSQATREQARLLDEQRRKIEEAAAGEAIARKHADELIKEKAALDVLTGSLNEQNGSLMSELEKLRRQVHDLKQESADKEVKLVQFEKRHQQDKEDKLGLNIALDSKQQELELIKRKLGVRGTAGSTPAPATRPANRRESSLFNTPMPRPPSAMSNASDGTRQSDTPVISKPFTLGKSGRASNALNSSTGTAPPSTLKAARFTDMGPPPPKSRMSISSTASNTPSVTRKTSTMVRSASARPTLTGASASNSNASVPRRPVSAVLSKNEVLSDSSSVQDDKENAQPSTRIPTPSSRRVSALVAAS